MRIGELARRTGTTPSAIRFYEQQGVLPEPGRTPVGYREYDEDAVTRLEFVRAAQAVGLTLGQIREIIALRDRGEAPCAHVTELLHARLAEVERRIAALTRTRAELDSLVERARVVDPDSCPPATICRILAPERAGS